MHLLTVKGRLEEPESYVKGEQDNKKSHAPYRQEKAKKASLPYNCHSMYLLTGKKGEQESYTIKAEQESLSLTLLKSKNPNRISFLA